MKWTTPEGEVLKASRAVIYAKYPKDFRIRWVGPMGTDESGNPYPSREKATLLAIECGAGKVEQDYNA